MKDPKEKAKELVDRFYHKSDLEDLLYVQCKQCALICVDEIMQALSIIPYGMEYLSQINYWEGVKTEIENL